MACCGGLHGILIGLTKSTDHASGPQTYNWFSVQQPRVLSAGKLGALLR